MYAQNLHAGDLLFQPLPSEHEDSHIERCEELFVHRGLNTGMGGAFSVFDPGVTFEPAAVTYSR